MSRKDPFIKAHALVHKARNIVTAHLHPGFYDFVFEDFTALLFTLLLLAKEAERITPPNTEAPHDS